MDDMINVVSKQCKSCNLFRCIKKYDYYCYGCFCFNNPDHKFVRQHKNKENIIMPDLLIHFPNIIRDKITLCWY